MTVRCKMTASSVIGRVGKAVNFNAVYEGSTELQGLSENAIFGNASPSGYMTIVGDVDAPFFREPTQDYDPRAGDEFYIDLDRRGDETAHDALFQVAVIKAFESKPNPNFPDNPTEFRYVNIDGPISVSFGISVKNPVAIEMMQKIGIGVLTVRSALCRRSDKEIALHKANYDAQVQRLKQDYPDWDEAKIESYSRWARDKWLRAQGQRPE